MAIKQREKLFSDDLVMETVLLSLCEFLILLNKAWYTC